MFGDRKSGKPAGSTLLLCEISVWEDSDNCGNKLAAGLLLCRFMNLFFGLDLCLNYTEWIVCFLLQDEVVIWLCDCH